MKLSIFLITVFACFISNDCEAAQRRRFKHNIHQHIAEQSQWLTRLVDKAMKEDDFLFSELNRYKVDTGYIERWMRDHCEQRLHFVTKAYAESAKTCGMIRLKFLQTRYKVEDKGGGWLDTSFDSVVELLDLDNAYIETHYNVDGSKTSIVFDVPFYDDTIIVACDVRKDKVRFYDSERAKIVINFYSNGFIYASMFPPVVDDSEMRGAP